MPTAIRAYLDEALGSAQDPDPVLYVERDERGPLTVITPSGTEAGERYRLPESAVGLQPRDDILDEVSEALSTALDETKTTKTVRKAIGEALRELGVDKDDADWWSL